jgi:octaprenyl-diphosphate synthase
MNNDFSSILQNIEKALAAALPKEATDGWKGDSFGPLSQAVSPLYLQNLIEANKALIDLGGKRWRPLFLILCYQLFKNDRAITEEETYSLTPLVEFVHTASLIHDDIEDKADLRRGKPAAHITYGLDTALNAASWLYFEAPVCINKSKISEELKLTLYKVYTKELRRLHLGQAMDIYWHRNPEIFPSRDEYEAMVKCKTGTLASLAAQIGCLAAGLDADKAKYYGDIAAAIGKGFQIIDDVINLTSGNPGKKRGDDIVEGKKSLPVIMHIEENPGDKEKIAALMKKASEEGINSPAVEECISLLEKGHCINKAAEEGIRTIKENCALFNSDRISELFTAMIPETFR